jgi:hypothetical protein
MIMAINKHSLCFGVAYLKKNEVEKQALFASISGVATMFWCPRRIFAMITSDRNYEIWKITVIY